MSLLVLLVLCDRSRHRILALVDTTDAHTLPIDGLLPQDLLIVSALDSQDAGHDGPTHMPHIIELMHQFEQPHIARGIVTCPNHHMTILRAAGDGAGGQANGEAQATS